MPIVYSLKLIQTHIVFLPQLALDFYFFIYWFCLIFCFNSVRFNGCGVMQVLVPTGFATQIGGLTKFLCALIHFYTYWLVEFDSTRDLIATNQLSTFSVSYPNCSKIDLIALNVGSLLSWLLWRDWLLPRTWLFEKIIRLVGIWTDHWTNPW